MLMVAYRGSGNIAKGTILFKVDAWQQDCMEQAMAYIRKEHWVPTGEEVTLNGNMIIWVE